MAEDEPGLEPLPEDRRLDALDARLRRARGEEADRTGAAERGDGDGYRLGNHVLAELVGGMVGGR
ncbi:hypothetical protein [Sphingomonas changnyeongensis]|uniref:hypothetical protein n=1 Tax=Sphingomonas changnyeongensis TaxID=2698679 RepID=UPI002E19F74E